MDENRFWELYESREFDTLQVEFDKGLSFEFDVNRSALNASYGGADYETLYFLWRNNAKAGSPFLEKVFNKFKKGKSAQDVIEEKSITLTGEENDYEDLSSNFSVDKLTLTKVSYEHREEDKNIVDSEFILFVNFIPFIYNSKKVTPSFKFVCFSNPLLKGQIMGKGYFFSKKDSLEPSSIYLQSVHNPVDLKWIKIEKGVNFEMIDFKLFFDFEFERTDYKNQELDLTFKIDIRNP